MDKATEGEKKAGQGAGSFSAWGTRESEVTRRRRRTVLCYCWARNWLRDARGHLENDAGVRHIALESSSSNGSCCNNSGGKRQTSEETADGITVQLPSCWRHYACLYKKTKHDDHSPQFEVHGTRKASSRRHEASKCDALRAQARAVGTLGNIMY